MADLGSPPELVSGCVHAVSTRVPRSRRGGLETCPRIGPGRPAPSRKGVRVLRGQLVTLRSRRSEDVPVLHEHLHDDVPTHLLSASGPWRPSGPEAPDGPFAVRDPRDDMAVFSVVETRTDALAGSALLWGIDPHNRNAHIGLSLLPAVRGRGLGADVVAVLCDYGFSILGLHRLQIETSVDNPAMRRVAERAGFRQEGVHREAYWTAGRFVDDVLFGLLADEWADRPR